MLKLIAAIVIAELIERATEEVFTWCRAHMTRKMQTGGPAEPAVWCSRCKANTCEHNNRTDWTCVRACSKCAPVPSAQAA